MNDRLTTTEAQRQPTHDYLSGASDPGRTASNVTWNVDRYGFGPCLTTDLTRLYVQSTADLRYSHGEHVSPFSRPALQFGETNRGSFIHPPR